ncbi:Origin recognition complex, subunit 2 [Beauveria brongniartii RCEF 3172]|uniref:Origin recognition complex subunit 2 n=1 Tax=Beauveria brongniartii RCEF 3172 TaxID=1081107 RepID=A0A167D639_9HYPO|nr:Origin recognition complex, subunit 2 [Beauveria brongniartii RCEF 3172]
MDHAGHDHDEGPPTKRQRSAESLDATMLSASEDILVNGFDPAMDTQVTDDAASEVVYESTPVVTPRKRGRPPKHTPTKSPATPSTSARNTTTTTMATAHLTPLKAVGPNASTPGRHAADRSARRKTARALLEHATGDGPSDDDAGIEDDQEEDLARAIFGDTSDEDEDDGLLPNADAADAATAAATTPTKKKQRRPRKRAKSPTPPRDLPPQEMYFFHNKPGRPKTSDNTLAGLRLLTHDEYFDIVRGKGTASATTTQRHAKDVEYLETLHAESFAQWALELAHGFSLCLYGYGSKRALLKRFAAYLHDLVPESPIVVVNGYAPTTNIRDILACVARAVLPPTKKKSLPSAQQPLATARSILAHLAPSSSSSSSPATLTIVVHSIDASALRRSSPSSYAVLACLAAHPAVHFVCSADAPDFPLLWDVGARSAFSFVFHDATTFAPLAGGAELDPVDEVHELLGRKAHRVHGREGVAFVLKSLPENARNLFRLLVGEVLVAMDEDAAGREDGAAGVEYRMVYNKAVEEFVCSSEMAFRTLLKEFHDHQIITSRKDALGTELLSLPFGREELEAILEDLMA